jgi:hypothetical protein
MENLSYEGGEGTNERASERERGNVGEQAYEVK